MNKPITITALALLAVSPFLATRLTTNLYEGGFSRNEGDREIRNSSAIATILGEIRTNMSDLMFIKTERYLHAGVAYAAHLDMDAMASSGEIQDEKADKGEVGLSFAADLKEHESEVGVEPGTEHEEQHEEAATVVPPAEADFRGFVGHLQRAVKPWQDPTLPHVHTTGTELLPWYRVMTLTDPHNIRGYMIGTWWLTSKKEDRFLEEGLRFIEEGIKNNPRAFALHLTRGLVVRDMAASALKAGKGEEELRLKLNAKASFRQAAELAMTTRPHDAANKALQSGERIDLLNWTEYNEEDARGSVRLAVFHERDLGSVEEARSMATRYIAAFGSDGPLQNFLDGKDQ
jgi:hypothetical protein